MGGDRRRGQEHFVIESIESFEHLRITVTNQEERQGTGTKWKMDDLRRYQ